MKKRKYIKRYKINLVKFCRFVANTPPEDIHFITGHGRVYFINQKQLT